MTRVVLYSRDGCHLCDDARELLIEVLRERADAELIEIDIDSDDGLLRRFLERIPVIEVDGQIISELVPDPRALRSTLLHTSAG